MWLCSGLLPCRVFSPRPFKGGGPAQAAAGNLSFITGEGEIICLTKHCRGPNGISARLLSDVLFSP